MEKFEIGAVTAVIGTWFTFLFGAFDTVFGALLLFIALDYVTGVIVAINNKNVSSEIGAKGLTKKAMILLIVIAAVALDRLLGTDSQHLVRTAVCFFYIANEGISLLENAANLGLPIPNKIKDVLAQLKNEGDKPLNESEEQ